jgi:hypothetical protein
MFPKLIRDQPFTTQDKYNIIVNDDWIHGDDSVKLFLNKKESDEKIPEWNPSNPDRIEILKELRLESGGKKYIKVY